ncbi:hypothetical protein ACFVXW_18815 [Streptomyces sp. NPDC058251]
MDHPCSGTRTASYSPNSLVLARTTSYDSRGGPREGVIDAMADA